MGVAFEQGGAFQQTDVHCGRVGGGLHRTEVGVGHAVTVAVQWTKTTLEIGHGCGERVAAIDGWTHRQQVGAPRVGEQGVGFHVA